MSRICMSHVTNMSESRRTYEWVISRVWMSDVTHLHESCQLSTWVMSYCYKWVTSQIWVSHVVHMNESCHASEWVMPQICMSHVTHLHESCHIAVNESCQTYECTMSQMNEAFHTYGGVATVSRIDKITGLFCRIWSLLYGSFAKESYNLIDPTNRNHPIWMPTRIDPDS